MNKTEYLSKDILEEDFMKFISSFRPSQMFTGSCRVDARDRFVTAPTVYQKSYTIITLIPTILLSIIAFNSYVYELYHGTKIYLICMIGLSIHLTTYLSNLIHVRFVNSDANVKFYMKMQETDRMMRIESNKPMYNMLHTVNNRTMLTLAVVFCILITLSVSGGLIMVLAFLGVALSHGVFVVEISYCTNLVMYFYTRTRFINSIIANHIKKPAKKKEKSGCKDILTRSFMRRLAAESHDLTTSDTDAYLKAIFDCFSMFQVIYRFQIFMFFLDYTLYSILCFEYGIKSLQANTITIQEWIVIITAVIVGYLQEVLLCGRCELFYKEVKETKRLSVAIMSLHLDGPLRAKAKKMVEMIEVTPPRLSVYDMWQVDGRLMLKLFNIMTTFFVTLLQFAFL